MRTIIDVRTPKEVERDADYPFRDARADDDPTEIHAMRHRTNRVWGVQFHPESIMTPDGKALLRNFLELAR